MRTEWTTQRNPVSLEVAKPSLSHAIWNENGQDRHRLRSNTRPIPKFLADVKNASPHIHIRPTTTKEPTYGKLTPLRIRKDSTSSTTRLHRSGAGNVVYTSPDGETRILKTKHSMSAPRTTADASANHTYNMPSSERRTRGSLLEEALNPHLPDGCSLHWGCSNVLHRHHHHQPCRRSRPVSPPSDSSCQRTPPDWTRDPQHGGSKLDLHSDSFGKTIWSEEGNEGRSHCHVHYQRGNNARHQHRYYRIKDGRVID